jgi:hypothetical protein
MRTSIHKSNRGNQMPLAGSNGARAFLSPDEDSVAPAFPRLH